MRIRRGDIFYVKGEETRGSEMHGNRPAVIVSNDVCNKHSPVVEVVYLTTRSKNPLPTHFKIKVAATGKWSTVLCEQIWSVSADRLCKRMGRLNASETAELDRALTVSIGLAPHVNSVTPKPRLQLLPALRTFLQRRFARKYITAQEL